ncbi:MAG: glycosyl hydrolase, partial [Robiginitalea sp.]
VREDPKRPGLLYAGTETGLQISLDGGQSWQPFQLNLPVVPINDLTIRQNDLVAATAGRSFWILDDLSPLQQQRQEGESTFLANPRDTYLYVGGSSQGPGIGQNPKSGVILDYYLEKPTDSSEISLAILDGGTAIRTYTNKSPGDFKTWPGGPPKPEILPSKHGFNRFVWDFRRDALPAVEKVFVFGDYRGSQVAPGTYTARLTVDGQQTERTFRVLPHPGIDAPPDAYRNQQEALAKIDAAIRDMHNAVGQLRKVSSQIKSYESLLEGNDTAKPLLKKGEALKDRITQWEESLIQPRQKTFQDVINFNNRLNAELMYLRSFIDVAEPTLTQGARDRLADLIREWGTLSKERDAIVGEGMAEFNALYRELDLPALILKEE